MHILLMSDNFTPEVNAPASRGLEHCREWVKAGHEVTVLTSVPNFPRGIVFPGYSNRLWQSETIEGIRVVRVWTFISANQGFAYRVLDYLSFMITALVASLFIRRVDVIMGTSPQFFTVCAAWAASAVRHTPFIFELRDLWPQSIPVVRVMRDGLMVGLLSRIEMFLYRRAAMIVVVTHSFKQILAARGIDPEKIAVVTNGVDLQRFQPAPRDAQLEAELGLTNRFVAGYIGTHGLAHGLDTVLDAARLLRDGGNIDVRILMLGDGAEKAALKRRAQAEKLDAILFVDTVPKDQVCRYWSLLDCSIIHLRRDDLFRSVIPSKLFEAMATGTPVVLGVEGEAAELVLRYEAGIAVEPENAAALVAAILSLRDDSALRRDLSDKAAQAARRFSRPALASAVLQTIESVVPQKGLVQAETN